MYASQYNLIFREPNNGLFLLLNPLSGVMDLFDAQAISLLDQPDNPQMQRAFPDFFKHCRDRGYLYDSPQDEEIVLEAAYERSLNLYRRQPFRAEIYLTLLCNLRCTYCFQGHRLHDRANLIQIGVIEKLFDNIAELSQLWGSHEPPIVNLVGGEPLLNRKNQREAITKILDLAARQQYRVGVITNGVELAAYCEVFARYHPQFIQVTLDGPKQVHDQRRIFADGEGSFDYVVQGIDRAVKEGLNVVIRVNIDSQNVNLLPVLADFILAKGWLEKGVVVGVTPVDEFVPESELCSEQAKLQTLESLLEVKRQYKQTEFFELGHRLAQFFEYIVANGCLPAPTFKYCPAVIGNQVSFDYDGKMYACC